jgi:choloylglycine hydrolase
LANARTCYNQHLNRNVGESFPEHKKTHSGALVYVREHLAIILMIAAGVAAPAHPAGACSTFCAAGAAGPVFGKNYDWEIENGLVVVNKRGVSKTAMTSDNPARWTSVYGSVTFNQYGREMPCGGINEAGLVIEIMWLDETVFPESDGRASLPDLQWVQYHLDRSATVQDVIDADRDVRISGGGEARVHYLVADRSGASATIEFLDGKMVSHTGESLPHAVLTNHTYENSLEYLGRHRGFGGEQPVRGTTRSLDRFARAAQGVRDFEGVPGERAVETAFGILADVSQGAMTRWSIVYDIGELRVYFRTFDNATIRYVDLGDFDFSCRSPVTILDIQAGVEGDAKDHFKPYSRAANFRLVKTAFSRTDFLVDTPAEHIEFLAGYPETTECVR